MKKLLLIIPFLCVSCGNKININTSSFSSSANGNSIQFPTFDYNYDYNGESFYDSQINFYAFNKSPRIGLLSGLFNSSYYGKYSDKNFAFSFEIDDKDIFFDIKTNSRYEDLEKDKEAIIERYIVKDKQKPINYNEALEMGFFSEYKVLSKELVQGKEKFGLSYDYFYKSKNVYNISNDPYKYWEMFGSTDATLFFFSSDPNYFFRNSIQYYSLGVHAIYSNDYSNVVGIFSLSTDGHIYSLLLEDGYDNYIDGSEYQKRYYECFRYGINFGRSMFYITKEQSFDDEFVSNLDLDRYIELYGS